MLCNDLSDQMEVAEQRTKDISELQRQIKMHSKTHEIYTQYRKLAGRKQVRFYEQHSREIENRKEVKRSFNSLGLKKLSSVQSLKLECAALEAKKGRNDRIAHRQNNVDRILGVTEKEKNRDR